MKLSMIVYLFFSLFGAGFAFFRLNSYFAEQKFRFTLKTAAASVWVSAGLWAAVRLLHHQGMLLSEHLIFDALGSLFLAVMLSCGLALLREAGFFPRKKQIPQPCCRRAAGLRDRKVLQLGKQARCSRSAAVQRRAV